MIWLILALSLVAGCLHPSDDPLHYKEIPFKYVIDQDFPEAYRGGVHAAARLINERFVEPLVEFDGVKQYSHDEYPARVGMGDNVIHATDHAYPEWNGEEWVDTDYIAIAVPRGGSNNEILDCDIYLYNFTRNFIEGRKDDPRYNGKTVSLVLTIAHEIFHCLGISHSDDASCVSHGTHHNYITSLGWGARQLCPAEIDELLIRYEVTLYKPEWLNFSLSTQGRTSIPAVNQSRVEYQPHASPLRCTEIHVVEPSGNTTIHHAVRSPTP